MDPRYSGRLSPPRRYAAPGRNSTGRLDTDYESYYPPRGSRESIIPGPRTSADRIIPSRFEPRIAPISRSSRDDYYVAPRYAESGSTASSARRPSSIVVPASSSTRYRPVVTSATDIASSPYSKYRNRDDEAYYVQPASSSGHNRHSSLGSGEPGRYLSTREPQRERPMYKGSALRHGEYLLPAIVPRDARDSRDRDYGYEYTTPKEQAYRDFEAAPRPRVRRVSDIGSRDRPTSLIGSDEYRRSQGPPVTTRGFSNIKDDNTVRREYRYPRDEPSSRDTNVSRASRDEREKPKTTRHLVAVHQDEGYSSNIDDRVRDKSHHHRKHREGDRDKYSDIERRDDTGKKHYGSDTDDRRIRHTRTESEDRRHKLHRHRHDVEEPRGSRDEGYDRNDEDRDRRRRHDDSKKDKTDDRKTAEGVALGAAGVGAAGLLAEGLRHRKDRDSPDQDSDTKDRPRRRHHKDVAESDRTSEETEEDRRERRRRRRKEREEREAQGQERGGSSTKYENEEQHDKGGRTVPIAIVDPRGEDKELRPDQADDRTLRRHGHPRRDRGSSSDTTESYDDTRRGTAGHSSAVRVVSPAREDGKKPRGILRPPTQKFPEDPAPIREGVAPLKDAGKKGIPLNARWTKIDRKFVNPEALELGNERYEERPDFVIVLRVLTKEDIEKYALITQELRARRSTTDEGHMLEGRRHHDDSSDSDRPKQIAPHAHEESGRGVPPIPDTAGVIGDSDRDRPSLEKEPSYQRFAPPGIQPSSNIPTYPPIPGRPAGSATGSQASSTPSTGHDSVYPSQGGGYKAA